MLNRFNVYIVTILSFLLFNNYSIAQLNKDSIATNTLLVGVAGSEPFVFDESASEKGIAVELWEELADKKDWAYTYKYFETVDDANDQLEAGKIDAVVGPISITSDRVESSQFSQPFYNSSLAIVSRTDELTLWDKVKPFFSLNLLYAVFVFVFILAVVGTFLWAAERKASPDQFPSDPVHGIGTGMWLAIVTMTTVGYGDKAPVSLAGRIIAGTWMVVSIIFATSMVAGIASTLTLSSLGSSTISNIEELSGKKAATIDDSPSEHFLKENNVKPVTTESLEESMEKLKNEEVDAVVYDRPQLLFYISNHQNENYHIAKAEYYKQGYGFAFSLQSDLVYEVNRSLLELAEDQEVISIIEEYLDKDE